jgi:hypothetical protein
MDNLVGYILIAYVFGMFTLVYSNNRRFYK